jgi:hypothetical protein
MVEKPGGEHLEGLSVHGRIILKWIVEKYDTVVDWIHPTEDEDL